MRKRRFRYLILLLLIGSLAVPQAFSQGQEESSAMKKQQPSAAHGHNVSPAMKKQHYSMKAVGSRWQAFRKALPRGDGKAADKALARMLEDTLSLEEFQLHRNADKGQQFIERSREFREKIVKLKDALQAGDGKQVRELEKAVGEDCLSCHAMFK